MSSLLPGRILATLLIRRSSQEEKRLSAIAVENTSFVPFTRSRITPFNTIRVYKISTEEMKEFLQQKLSQLKKGTKVDLIATFSQPLNKEKKKKKERKRYTHPSYPPYNDS